MNKIVVRDCPICNNNKAEMVYTQKFYDIVEYKLPTEYDVVVCEKCGFVYADTDAKQESYNNYYEKFSKYEDENTSHQIILDENDISYINRIYEEFSKVVSNKNMKIMDLGCGPGWYLQELKKRGYTNLTGVDVAKNAIEKLRRNGINGINKDVFLVDNHENKYDCIISTCVLEHIMDLNRIVSKIHDLLNENGFFYVVVPNSSKYDESYTVPYRIFNMEHINHFDIVTLKNLICNHGFELVEFNTITHKINTDINEYLLCATFKKINIKKHHYEYSELAKKAVKNYIKLSEEDKRYDKIEEYLQSGEPIFIWGTGSYFLRLLANSQLVKCNIYGYIDNNVSKINNYINGKKIYSPEVLLSNNYPIIICVELYSTEIIEQIIKMNISNKIVKL